MDDGMHYTFMLQPMLVCRVSAFRQMASHVYTSSAGTPRTAGLRFVFTYFLQPLQLLYPTTSCFWKTQCNFLSFHPCRLTSYELAPRVKTCSSAPLSQIHMIICSAANPSSWLLKLPKSLGCWLHTCSAASLEQLLFQVPFQDPATHIVGRPIFAVIIFRKKTSQRHTFLPPQPCWNLIESMEC